MNVNEECLLKYLKEEPAIKRKGLAQPLLNELEALRPIYRRKKFVSFPMNILLNKLETLLN